MCNACGNQCCGSDMFGGCGCDGCDCEDCWSDDDGPECDHEDYEADILTGLATCGRCNHRWMQTPAEIERERIHAAAYDKLCAEWALEPVSNSYKSAPTGDDIPF